MASNTPPPPAFESAFEKLSNSVSPSDALVFQNTSLEDVWKAAEDIQESQRQRKSLRNMRRIEPFLQGLEKFSKVIEVLCNSTPYLPWIWAPIKLMMQIASEYSGIFDKLIDAYAQISEVMPQFDRLQGAFRGDQNFQVVLGLIYADILEFHRRAYKFFRRRSWHIFFDSLWSAFNCRFHGILKSLAHHQKLLMKEVTIIDAVEARGWRSKVKEDLARQEKDRVDLYLHDSIAWLKVADERLDDELEQLSSRRQAGTCKWILRNPKFLSWKDDAHGEWIIWLKGIPGAGKTILSTYVIRHLQNERSSITAAYHICNSYTSGKNLLAEIFRSLALQLLRASPELAPYVFDNYANRGLAPATMHLKRLLPELLSTIPSVRIFVDGIDEYPESDQRTIFQELLSLVKSSNGQCRILFSNRDGVQIDRVLRNKPIISLKDESTDVNKDIESCVRENLAELRHRFKDNRLLLDIQNQVVFKAKGMFLWVRLIIQSLKECHSVQELRDAIDRLPDGLDEAYGRILSRVLYELGAHSSVKAMRILEWIACSFRLMKVYEVQDGIVFHSNNRTLNDDTKLTEDFIDLCKPLIEAGPNNTIDFVHYSAKEYILHVASGPFLQYNQAHYNLAYSCISYMNTSICFHRQEVSEKELTVNVVKGFHGLHHYANEFWFQHLLQYAKCEESVSDDHIDEPLEELQEYWKTQPGVASLSLKLDDTISADNIRTQLEPLRDINQALGMGLDLLTFRKFMVQEKYSHQDSEALKTQEIKYDPTHFTEVSQRYQAIAQQLITWPPDDLPGGISAKMLHQFKSIYQKSALICRYRDCPRSSDGFEYSRDRDLHESLHVKPLRCADPSCPSFSVGFRSKTGLLKHNRRWHPRIEDTELPEFEPRKQEQPEPLNIPSPTPPSQPLSLPPLPDPPPTHPLQIHHLTSPPTQSVKLHQTKKYDPRAPRKSRAKRGLPVHDCRVCNKVFTRAEGLRRHEAIHGAPGYVCTYESCARAFFRPDLLRRHIVRHNMNGDARKAVVELRSSGDDDIPSGFAKPANDDDDDDNYDDIDNGDDDDDDDDDDNNDDDCGGANSAVDRDGRDVRSDRGGQGGGMSVRALLND